jgi:molecular chaperone DnaK
MGAAVQAAINAGADVGAVLVDITPHSLGIKVLDESMGFRNPGHPFRFAPIIHRNTPLPASRSELFHTTYDDQREVDIEVYQGESDDPHRNHQIGKFRVVGLAPVPAGNPILVQLDLNLDGILKVSAKERATGLQKQITIENALARFVSEERDAARERLSRLWEGDEELETVGMNIVDAAAAPAEPELVQAPREGQREAVQAKALLEKAERLLAKVQPEDRGELERLMTGVRTALTDRKWDHLTQMSNELTDVLFYLEDA